MFSVNLVVITKGRAEDAYVLLSELADICDGPCPLIRNVIETRDQNVLVLFDSDVELLIKKLNDAYVE